MRSPVSSALVAVALVAMLAPCVRVRAEDAPPKPAAAPPAPSPLTADEKEFFTWWDTLGYPDVTRLPFVKLWTPYHDHDAAANDESWPEGAFLLREDGRKFMVFHTDLTVERLEATEADPKDKPDRRTAFERADLERYVRGGIEKLEKVGPEVPWFSKPDPFDAHRWSIPNQAFRIAVLARACAGHGLDDLAHALLDRARHEETRPAMTQQWGKDDPRPRASLDAIKASIEAEADDVLTRSFSDASRTWSNLLSDAERWARGFAPHLLTSPDGMVAQLRRIVEDEKTIRDHPLRPFESLTQDERIERLIHDLRDVGTFDQDSRQSDQEKKPPNAAEQLKTIGFPAVPALIDALDDERLSRSVHTEFSFHGQYRDSASGQRVGDLAWEILDHLSGGTLEKAPHGGPPTSGQPTKRQIAQRWYASVKGRGEVAVLADAVKKGGDGSRAAADRLVKLDPAATVEALEIGITAAPSGRGSRENLVYALVAIKTDAATAALLRLLPALHGSDAGVTVASSLFRRGRRAGLDDLIRKWKEEANGNSGPFGTPAFRHGFGDVVTALVATKEINAVHALAEGLSSRGVHDRLGVIQAFWPTQRPTGLPGADATPPSEEVERTIEALLADRLEDVERIKGMTMGGEAVGQQPIIGEIAAWTLAQRYPKRYTFDPDGSPHDREAQRIAAANVWRAAHAMPGLTPPTKRPAPAPIPIEAIRADIDAAASAPDAAKRAAAVTAIEAKGLPAVPALREAWKTLAKDAPGRADLESLVRRLALVVADVEIDGDATLAGDAFKSALDAAKGKPISGAMWWDLYAKFSTSAPDGATTQLALSAERDGAERGVLLRATLTKTKPGIGTQDEGDASFEHPTIRRNDDVKSGGSGAMPISVFARPHGFLEYETKLNDQLAAAGPDDVVSVEGEVTVHR
jgi:hypothetical protein